MDNIRGERSLLGADAGRSVIAQDVHAPYTVTIAGRSFINTGRFGWGSGGKSQFSVAPAVIAVRDRAIIGWMRFGSSSCVLCKGGEAAGDQRSEMVSRMEYDAVRIVASMNTLKIIKFIGLNINISIIKSFE